MSSAVLTDQTHTSAPVSGRGDVGGKYLTFELGAEEFGIRVLQVREIMGLQDVTTVPQMPAHVKGVINLRGKVIPVICLRAKFRLEAQEYTTRTCIIVVQVKGKAGPLLVGVIVDGVSEVLNVSASDVEDTPDFGSGASTQYLLGLAKIKNKVKILLDIDQVAGTSELYELNLPSAA
jgi:purine-binding chemotaxis protein CheW